MDDVDKYLRSTCKSARKRLAEIRSQMQEHHGRGLMAVHNKSGFRIAVVPETLKTEQGLLVIPCSIHLNSARGVGVHADKLEVSYGNLKIDEFSTHHFFFPDGDTRQLVDFHIGDPAFLAWYMRFGIDTLCLEAPRIAARLEHAIRPEDLVSYRKEYQQYVVEQTRYYANGACAAAEKLYKDQPRNRQEKEESLHELERAHRWLNELLARAETAGLDPAVLKRHRAYYDERLAAYT